MDTKTIIELICSLAICLLNGVVIWSWQQMREELRQLKETRCKTCESQLSEKASRTRVMELEKRVEGIEKVGMNQLFLDNLRTTLANIEKKLDDNGKFIGRVEESLKKIDTVERKMERHLDRHLDEENGK